MRLFVDAWDPAYGTGIEPTEEGPSGSSSAELDTDVEFAADGWHPVEPPAGLGAPDVVLFVDGVRRIDARVWLGEDDHQWAGLAASYAAGVVQCDMAAGVADLAAAAVERGIFTAAPDPLDVGTPPVRYTAFPVTRGEPSDLVNGVQAQLRTLEIRVATDARRAIGDALLVVDGPLRGRAHLPHALGYVKTHRTNYLPERLSSVVAGLNAGQRSPVFLLGTNWRRFTWYLRLPGPVGAAWSGIVRLECPADLDVSAAVELADLSAATLPRFASVPYKDPRAPQNLVPIAGLERRLRGMLGDARLLHRSLMRAASVAADLTGGAA